MACLAFGPPGHLSIIFGERILAVWDLKDSQPSLQTGVVPAF